MRGSVLIAAAVLGVVACGTSEPSQDPTRCQQTFEFGNTGCAEMTGTVTDHLGAPVVSAGVMATPADPARLITLVYDLVQTDATGAYRLRVIRMTGSNPVGRPDTVTVWVRAAARPPNGLPPGTTGVDSVLATLEIRPVGELPAVTTVAPIAIPGL